MTYSKHIHHDNISTTFQTCVCEKQEAKNQIFTIEHDDKICLP